jgi:hypothetical protein
MAHQMLRAQNLTIERSSMRSSPCAGDSLEPISGRKVGSSWPLTGDLHMQKHGHRSENLAAPKRRTSPFLERKYRLQTATAVSSSTISIATSSKLFPTTQPNLSSANRSVGKFILAAAMPKLSPCPTNLSPLVTCVNSMNLSRY